MMGRRELRFSPKFWLNLEFTARKVFQVINWHRNKVSPGSYLSLVSGSATRRGQSVSDGRDDSAEILSFCINMHIQKEWDFEFNKEFLGFLLDHSMYDIFVDNKITNKNVIKIINFFHYVTLFVNLYNFSLKWISIFSIAESFLFLHLE